MVSLIAVIGLGRLGKFIFTSGEKVVIREEVIALPDETRSSQEMDDARNVRQETVHALVSDVVNVVSQELSQTTVTMTDEQLIAAIWAAMKKELEHKSSLEPGASGTRLSVNLEKCKLNLELRIDKKWFIGNFNPGDIDLCNIGNVILKSIKAIYPIIPICIITNKSFSLSECTNLIVEAVMQDKKIQAEIAKPTKT